MKDNNDRLQLIRSRAELALALSEAQADDDDRDEIRQLAEALEIVIDSIPGNDGTIFGLDCRAAIAEARGEWRIASDVRRAQIGRMMVAVEAGGPTGITSLGRALLMKIDEAEIDDNLDRYEPDEIAAEWRMLIIDLWQAGSYSEALLEIAKIEKFVLQHGIAMCDISEWKDAILEDQMNS
ncbi:MAG: hypothetical protein R6X02_26580 [Enhygromyxa sp.]